MHVIGLEESTVKQNILQALVKKKNHSGRMRLFCVIENTIEWPISLLFQSYPFLFCKQFGMESWRVTWITHSLYVSISRSVVVVPKDIIIVYRHDYRPLVRFWIKTLKIEVVEEVTTNEIIIVNSIVIELKISVMNMV